MKQLTLTVVTHGDKCVCHGVISDDEQGGSAVPVFGIAALRTALLYLEMLSEKTMASELVHVDMMNNGKTLDELKAERTREHWTGRKE